ncbi:MAG TPA: hypothetical protein PKE32_07570 [Miltoncostaeaceae bacterium]|nr:hypothetical protein [Miltoncostaeaceae bacterium]
MTKYIYDATEITTREQAARQLRELADQFIDGTIELTYDDTDTATPVHEPLRIVVDLVRHRHCFELVMRARWDAEDNA